MEVPGRRPESGKHRRVALDTPEPIAVLPVLVVVRLALYKVLEMAAETCAKFVSC